MLITGINWSLVRKDIEKAFILNRIDEHRSHFYCKKTEYGDLNWDQHLAHRVHCNVRKFLQIVENNITCHFRKLELDRCLLSHSWLCSRLRLRLRQTREQGIIFFTCPKVKCFSKKGWSFQGWRLGSNFHFD